MTRLFTRLALLICVIASAMSLAPPAAGQNDPGQMSDLEDRRDELAAQLADVEGTIRALETRSEELEAEVESAAVNVELVADGLENTVDARRAPARTRVQIAIAGFVGGDPRKSALIDEMESVQGNDEPARRREMYGAVIDDAVVRLAEYDEDLRTLADEMTDTQARLTEAEDELAGVNEELSTSGGLRDSLGTELDDVNRRIDELRTLANRAVLTGLESFDDPSRPALAVKIDNVRAAWPQAGINQADIVYVEEVEGGLTRLAAVFHSTGSDVVGPVRSMRTGDFPLLAQFNSPLFANSGGNRGSQAALANSSLVDVGANASPDSYYRDNGRRRPNNLMSNTFTLWQAGAGRGARTPSPIFTFREPGTAAGPGARPATGVRIGYGAAQVDYAWNGTGWDRTQDGTETVDADGVRVSPPTVVVQVTNYGTSAADAASPEAITTGSGDAFIFTEGQVVDATWRRAGLDTQTEYVDANGNLLAISPGRMWIELPRPGRTTAR